MEELEDRVLDAALCLGGDARIWRSMADDRPERVVRGLVLDLYPGQESFSLLISPEGWLISLMDIENAEKGEIAEPPWCFVKTQFGGIEGHVVLVELLAALKQEFLPDLEISDEGEYWPNRDLVALQRKFRFLQSALDGLSAGLRRYGLSAEAAEDPEILAARVERVAEIVHRQLSEVAESEPPFWEKPDESGGDQRDWQRMHRAQRRQQERLQRAFHEHLARGEDVQQALSAAMHDLGIPDLTEQLAGDGSRDEPLAGERVEARDPAWRESLPEAVRDDGYLTRPADDNPLLTQARDLILRLRELFGASQEPNTAHLQLLYRGAGDVLGGLAQALGAGDWQPPPQLAVPQLKRALRGAASALGALFSLRAEGCASDESFDELRAALEALEQGSLEQLRRIREEAEE